MQPMPAHVSAEVRGEDLHPETRRLLSESDRILSESLPCLGTSGDTAEACRSAIREAKEKWEKQRFRVAVLALIKAGKSTLINAWLGNEFLPSSSAPETACIVRIQHDLESPQGRLFSGDKEVAAGAAQIRDYLASRNSEFRKEGASVDEELLLAAPLESLQRRTMQGARFEILDTPGPNEAGTTQLRTKVELLLSRVDVIVYLLDYTKLKSDEEKQILQKLAARGDIIRRNADRLFFVVNKIDEQNRHGLTPEQTAHYVAAVLKKQVPGAKIPPERILLLSADQALLARLVESGRASPRAVEDFARQQFGRLGYRDATLDSCRPHAATVLRESWLPQLDETVLSFIYRERSRLLVDSVLGDLERGLTNLQSLLTTASATLGRDVKQAESGLRELKKDLAAAEDEFKAIESAAARATSDAERLVRKEFDAFQRHVDALVAAALREDSRDDDDSTVEKLRRKAAALLGREVESTEKAHHTARELDASIEAFVTSEFEIFRVRLEQLTHETQVALFDSLAAAVQKAWRHVEGSVERRFEIKVQPVRVSFSTPDVLDEYEDHEKRIERYVKTRTERVETTKQVRQKVSDGGLCSKAKYRMATVSDYKDKQLHAIDPQKVRAVWSKRIEAMTKTSVTTARALIDDKIGEAVEKARQRIRAYKDDYVAAVEAQIRESRKGEAERKARLAMIERLRVDTEDTIKGVRLCLGAMS